VHHFGHAVDELVKLYAIEASMIGAKFEVSLDAENDAPAASFDLPFMPTSHYTAIFNRSSRLRFNHGIVLLAAAIASAMFVYRNPPHS
jgi:hypothetical protein